MTKLRNGRSALVYLLTRRLDGDQVLEEWDGHWYDTHPPSAHHRQYLVEWNGEIDGEPTSQKPTATKYLYSQMFPPPGVRYFQVRRQPGCPPSCISPYHAQLVDLWHGPAMRKKRKSSLVFPWEFPQVANRRALFEAILGKQVTDQPTVVTLEEYYKNHANEEERATRSERVRRHRPRKRRS